MMSGIHAETCGFAPSGKLKPSPLTLIWSRRASRLPLKVGPTMMLPRLTEDVPLKEDVPAYFEREVKPYVTDAWIDESRTKIGYEIPFTRHFYEYVSPRPLDEIDAEIRQLEDEIQGLLVVSR